MNAEMITEIIAGRPDLEYGAARSGPNQWGVFVREPNSNTYLHWFPESSYKACMATIWKVKRTDG